MVCALLSHPMKKSLPILTLCALTVVSFLTSGCVRDYDSKSIRGYTTNHPEVGSPEWVRWVDNRVDTRYANNVRAEPATQEWYAIVDYYVLRGFDWDYYPTGDYRAYRRTYAGEGDRTDYGNEGYRIERYGNDYPRSDYRTYRSRNDYSSNDSPTYRSRNGYASNGRWVEGSRSSYRSYGSARAGYYRGDYASAETRDRYSGPARFGQRDYRSHRNNRSQFKVGSLEWKYAVTDALLSGRVPKPPPRSNSWDAPLAPTH